MSGLAQTGNHPVRLIAVQADGAGVRDDTLAVEEALEIRVAGTAPVITMRTPGNDLELAAGLLLSEGLVTGRSDIARLEHAPAETDAVDVRLQSFTPDKAALLERASLSNSACGVCGKSRLNLELLRTRPPLAAGPRIDRTTVLALPGRLRRAQDLFARNGGLHAAALFDARGHLRAVREDVGRHNALDKLVGWALLNDQLPLTNQIVMLSGRASFELMQKAIMAGAPVVCAVSAPSSYALRLAREFGVTLVGFLRGERFNIYSGPERIDYRSARRAFQSISGGSDESRRVS